MNIHSMGRFLAFVALACIGLNAANPIVTFKASANGKFVCADNGGASPLIANRKDASTWEQFEKVDMGGGLFAFKALADGKFVCAENAGASALIANRQGPPNTWESFWIVDMGAGKVALKAAANNKFVCAENGGAQALIANRQGPPSTWETFEMAEVGGGGGMKPATSTTPFSIAVIPDSQFMVCWYQGGTPAMFERQVQWIADGARNPALNFVFASHVGDLTDNGAQQWQWDNAKNAMFKLDGVMPYGIAPGNHDAMVMWNNDYSLMNNGNFPPSKFAGQSWFGGTYQSGRYENNYELFSADGMDFIVLHMAWNPSAAVRSWASGVLRQYADRRAIVATHEYLPVSGGRTAVGEAIWNDVVKSNANVFLVICGHHHGENLVTSTNNAGGTVYQILTDYQGDNPQTGRMRYYTFKPGENQIVASTYSTETGTYRWVANLAYTMK